MANIPRKLREQAAKICRNTCVGCGDTAGRHQVCEIWPGTGIDKWNLITLCTACRREKHNRKPEEVLELRTKKAARAVESANKKKPVIERPATPLPDSSIISSLPRSAGEWAYLPYSAIELGEYMKEYEAATGTAHLVRRHKYFVEYTDTHAIWQIGASVYRQR